LGEGWPVKKEIVGCFIEVNSAEIGGLRDMWREISWKGCNLNAY